MIIPKAVWFPDRDLGYSKVFYELDLLLRNIYYRYGAQPLRTATIQPSALLLWGDEFAQKITRGITFVLNNSDGSEVALAYDQTARTLEWIVANKHIISFPFRVTANGLVFRKEQLESIKAWRVQEFQQNDYDIIMPSDDFDQNYELEAVFVLGKALQSIMNYLQITEEIVINVNNRKLFLWVAAYICGWPNERIEDCKNALVELFDKKSKVSQQQFIAQINEFVDIYQLDERKKTLLYELSEIKEFSALLKLLESNEMNNNSLKEFREEMEEFLQASADAPLKVCFDISLARGLDIYTGMVFEAFFVDNLSAIAGWWTYEEEICWEKYTGTWFSIWLDKILPMLSEKKSSDTEGENFLTMLTPTATAELLRKIGRDALLVLSWDLNLNIVYKWTVTWVWNENSLVNFEDWSFIFVNTTQVVKETILSLFE